MTDQIPHANAMPHCSQGVQIQRADVANGPSRLRAPFPYYGGKGRWAALIWERIGSPGVYVEPFLGSGAVLLAKPGGPAPREVVCDTNGHIANFYRALRDDPDAVAYHADWPTIHQDLTARHRWLLRWGAEHAERLSEDAEWYDPKAAGWWCWGISSWIGSGWCDENNFKESRPFIHSKPGPAGGGYGVQQQRTTLPVADNRPYVADRSKGGQGVQAQRDKVPADQIPFVNHMPGGNGVQAQKTDQADGILTGERLRTWFRALAQRLARVIVLNRSWESAVTPSVLQQTPSSPKPVVGIFMDPPYRTDTTGRSTGLYVGDRAGKSDDVAAAAYEWAVENGERFRIAYACHAGDFAVPDGWDVETMGFSGHRDETKKAESRDCVMFSPACVGQTRLF